MNKNRLILIILLVPAISAIFTACGDINRSGPMPNIILIYLDDLGYEDVSAYGAREISTPNIDMLSEGGIMFTDAHSSSATCTPSRYAILTGEYPWRNEKARVLSGVAPLLIDTAQLTLPRILKDKGYYTGIVGKWHHHMPVNICHIFRDMQHIPGSKVIYL